MATTEEKGILDFLAGALAAAVGEVAVNEIKKGIQTAAGEKAKALLVDSGNRGETFAALAETIVAGMKPEERKDACEKTRGFFVQAQREHEEGELNSLLAKVPKEGKANVLCMLGTCQNYQEFAETIRAWMAHDNAIQMGLKLVKKAESSGEHIVGDDVHKLFTVATTAANNAAGAMLPGLRRLEARLEEKYGKRR